MRSAIRTWQFVAAIAAAGAAPAGAGAGARWSLAPGLGAVDQDAIGGAPTVSIELEVSATPALAFGLRAGYFTEEDCCGLERDTLYGVLFGRLRRAREGVRPFVEAGGGRYEFEGHPLEGWFGGFGVDIPLSANRGVMVAARYHSVPRPPGGALPDFAEIQASIRFGF